jgi:hypothetical protein
MSSIRDIHLLFLQCENCPCTPRGFESDPCPECGGTLYSIKLSEYEIDHLTCFANHSTAESGAFNHQQFLESVSNLSWFAYNKEMMQACWVALRTQPVSDEVLQFLEYEFNNAPTAEEAEIDEDIAVDRWEREQEIYPLC